ncbi:1810_t:CDS:2 [Paraglomus occultum]|uniref:1810_t:CDS:1 n=1 Tax=Paraglomus occultum TaxID=144539 RepID=A0A9N8ZTY2_9GLOM|nr:1810_t:CDS:2 [Paraglomus occultum]
MSDHFGGSRLKYNLNKLRDTESVEHKKGNGRHSQVTQMVYHALGQHLHRNVAITTRRFASLT